MLVQPLDIVIRLRRAKRRGAVCAEAADEIERLRKELRYHVHTDEDIQVQNREIERLRAALKESIEKARESCESSLSPKS